MKYLKRFIRGLLLTPLKMGVMLLFFVSMPILLIESYGCKEDEKPLITIIMQWLEKNILSI